MVNISQCFHILGIIIPTDNIFQRDWNVLKLPTRKTWFITGQWWFYTGIFGILVSNMIHARIYTWGSHRTKSNIVQLSMLYYAEGNSLDMYTYSMIFYEFYDISVSCQIAKLQYPVPCKRFEEHFPHYSVATSRNPHMTLSVILQAHRFPRTATTSQPRSLWVWKVLLICRGW